MHDGSCSAQRFAAQTEDWTGLPAPTNDWQHITYAYDGETMVFYVAGMQKDGYNPVQLTLNTEPMSSSYPFVIFGNAKTRTDEPYYGHVARVRVWNRMLSGAEVSTDFADKTLLEPQVTAGLVANLVPVAAGSFRDTITATVGSRRAPEPSYDTVQAFPGCVRGGTTSCPRHIMAHRYIGCHLHTTTAAVAAAARQRQRQRQRQRDTETRTEKKNREESASLRREAADTPITDLSVMRGRVCDVF